MKKLNRFDVVLIQLDPTQGHEIQKTRPCLIISPDEMNRHLKTVIVAPMTTQGLRVPTRIPVQFEGKEGQIVLDQLRTVDRSRCIKHLGHIDDSVGAQVLSVLCSMFSH